MTVNDFIDRWQSSGASEHGNEQLFLSELCDLLDVPPPDPAGPDTRHNAYVFERRVDYPDQADRDHGYIDLYKRGCFVLEAKQGSDAPTPTEGEELGVEEPSRRYGTARRGRREWERAMKKATNQAFRYARGLPTEEGWPPFLVAVDVGYCIDLYADFARQGKNYVPFPFPAATEDQKMTIRELGAQLDRHRKERLDRHDNLTMTALYNVLKKERRGEDLDTEEREIHEKGLVGVLKELHDELDAAVARAYGWDPGLPEEEILQKLVDLNAQRRAEEEEGHVRYLRPEYQAPETVETQAELELDVQVGGDGAPAEPLDWPSDLKTRAQAVRAATNRNWYDARGRTAHHRTGRPALPSRPPERRAGPGDRAKRP